MAAREASSSSAGSIAGERAEPVTVSALSINNLQDALEALWLAYCGLLKSPSSGPPFAKEGYQKIRRGSVVVWADSNDSSLHDVLECGRSWSSPVERNGLICYTDLSDENRLRIHVDCTVSSGSEKERVYWHLVTYANNDPSLPSLPSLHDVPRFDACVAKLPPDFFTVLPLSSVTNSDTLPTADLGGLSTVTPVSPPSPPRTPLSPSSLSVAPTSPKRAIPTYRSVRFDAIGAGNRPRLKRSQSVSTLPNSSETHFRRIKPRPRPSLPLLPFAPVASSAPEVTHLEVEPGKFLSALSDPSTRTLITDVSLLVAQTSKFQHHLESLVLASRKHKPVDREMIDLAYRECALLFLQSLPVWAQHCGVQLCPSTTLSIVPGLGPTFAGFPIDEPETSDWSRAAFFVRAGPVRTRRAPQVREVRRQSNPVSKPDSDSHGSESDSDSDSEAEADTSARGWAAFGPISRMPLLGRHAKFMQECALRMMIQTGTRRHVLGVDLEGHEARFWFFDRSGSVHTSPVNINQRPDTFISLMLSLLVAKSCTLGHEATLGAPRPPSSLFGVPAGCRLVVASHSFALGRCIHITPSLYGRSTAVYEAERQTTPCNKHPSARSIPDRVIVKFSWQTTGQILEDELFRIVEQRGIHGVAELYLSSCLFRQSDGIRKHLVPPPRFLDRELRVQIMGPVCIPLYSITDQEVFKQAFRSLFKAHHDLYERGGILHRDINIGNLMVTAHNPSVGVLIDLDLAVIVRSRDSSHNIRASRVGTLPFLPSEFLYETLPRQHLYRHDTESFFFVLVWILWRYKGGQPVHTTMFHDWYDGTLDTMCNAKEAAFLGARRFPIAQFEDIRQDWVSGWGVQLSRGYSAFIERQADAETLGGYITFDEIFDILQD